jgi:hypothetical protein
MQTSNDDIVPALQNNADVQDYASLFVSSNPSFFFKKKSIIRSPTGKLYVEVFRGILKPDIRKSRIYNQADENSTTASFSIQTQIIFVLWSTSIYTVVCVKLSKLSCMGPVTYSNL